jgi:hypothetical protein
MRTFKEDLKNGEEKENQIFGIIKDYFKDDKLEQKKGKYDKYDFKGDNFYELKNRTNKFNQYPTTLIALDKIIADNLILLFNFTDGLYFIKYDKKLFDTFEIKKFQRGYRPDIKDVKKDYLYIPIENLTKIQSSI